MHPHTLYLHRLLHTSLSLYLGQESEFASIRDIPLPESRWLAGLLQGQEVTFEERVVLLLALMPHISPQTLDLFFMQNKTFDRPFTEFGGWKGISHGGFLPTGETAVFLLAHKELDRRQEVIRLFDKTHWFYTRNILRLEGHAPGEPLLSGRLVVSEDFLSRLLYGREYHPDYSTDFPAKRITSQLEWSDLVLPYNLCEELNNISLWLKNEQEIRNRWQLDRIIKPGYRCLFYGPSGTGKTLTATLLGKRNAMDVYRIDLSMVVSKYIGETEKNLAGIFDRAEHRNWILFFDEADALFGKRTQTQSSNDRFANQEVAYLLQRVEDFPGMVILATNMKENIDDAFLRRFQSMLYFPVPDERLRLQLWQKMIPAEWIGNNNNLLSYASSFTLAGGSMVNVIQYCAIRLSQEKKPILTEEILRTAITKEQAKEGRNILKNPTSSAPAIG
ncbi:ATP-binding protein [Parabacteroides sp. OttesenSCG-928-G06]|nr:ATP-binding protein [Parabacteroides sp. OttesenSCG-928-K15]MDL2282189.1 ATP-binding protein [Parabacteroides sp. OttesenSCG-928-G06]